MDLKQIEKLMAAMEESRIKRIVLKKEDYEIEIERECSSSSSLPTATCFSPPPSYPSVSEAKAPIPTPAHLVPTGQQEKGNAVFVTSPMVGTFYASPSPDDPVFIKPGDQITEESVVCIVEAMKVMNEVKAGLKGTVVEVLVKNGEPVEFGTQIIRVNPA